MIGVDEARERILSFFQPLDPVETPLLDALGLVTATDIISAVAVPPFRNSAMDGYALRSVDTRDAPVSLRVVATVAAGSVPTREVQEGEAIRIMTGAPLPAGADAVVRFEETDERTRPSMDAIRVMRPIAPHENVRDAGEDIDAGNLVIPAGTQLRPVEIGVLASLNLARVAVYRRPRVAILSTGNEVIDIGPELAAGQIRNSNSYAIAAMARQCGAEPVLLGVARDSADDLRAMLANVDKPDLFVTSGGVSHGDYDMVKDVLRSEGQIEIWQVRMKPGKPLAFGVLAGVPLLGLPGNPLAAIVAFEQFGRPALLRMLGHRDFGPRAGSATLSERVENRGGRRHFMRGVLEATEAGPVVRPVGAGGAGVLSSAIRANCYIVVPEDRESVEAHERIVVHPMEGCGPSFS